VAKRAPSFTVTAAGDKVTLDDSGEAKASFTVTNTTPQARRGHLVARPREPAKPDWFAVAGESVRDFGPNGAERVVAQLKVPPDSTPGSYSFRLDAISEADPDEDFTEGPTVAFQVPEPPKKKKRFPWWIVIVAAAVLLIVAGIVVWLLVRDSGRAAVPAVVGQPEPAAQTMIKNAGFGVKSVQVPVDDSGQNGVVQTQNPAAGSEEPKNTDVTINVGHMATVPDVTGETEARAKDEIDSADLRPAVREGPPVDAKREIGIVQRQEPPARTLRPPGTVVEIFVSRLIAVPALIGLKEESAVVLLREAGLTARVVERVQRPPELDDVVVGQTRGPREPVPPDTTVGLIVGQCIGFC
jgi:eukaryotic-like serine/threonine-protein kinase